MRERERERVSPNKLTTKTNQILNIFLLDYFTLQQTRTFGYLYSSLGIRRICNVHFTFFRSNFIVVTLGLSDIRICFCFILPCFFFTMNDDRFFGFDPE